MRMNKSAGKIVLVLLFVAIIVTGIQSCGKRKENMQASIASKILRFHILANSDVEKDQEVKEKVRDAVGAYLSPLLEEAKNLEETKEIVNAHLEDIVDVSMQTLQENGFDYTVTAKITNADFPEKTYGPYSFPKGTYEALQISIGEGKGHNWWCVLYPNMCFRGTVYEVVEEDAKEELKEVLSPEEYQYIFTSGKYEIRLKILEYFQ